MNAHIMDPVLVRDQVMTIVRRGILTGELKPNQKLSERALGESLGISTTPIKEAFRMLEAEGFLHTVPRKGTFVAEVYKENVIQITFIRSVLEGTAALFATNEATPDELDAMRDALQKAEKCIRLRDKEGLSYHNSCFHDVIRGAARNPFLFNLLKNLRMIDDSVRVISLEKSDEERMRDHQEHLAIYEAIRMGQGSRAEQVMVNHIRRVITETLDDRDVYKAGEKT